jgi:hypothetical protein
MHYPRDAWERLGRLLAARRAQIDPRYRIRKVFAAEVGAEMDIRESMLADLENAKRPNTFPPATIAAFETAYQLQPGSFEEALAGGELTPASRSLTLMDSPATTYPDEVGDDPFLRRIWDDEYAPEDERWAAIEGVKAHRRAIARKSRVGRPRDDRDATRRA